MGRSESKKWEGLTPKNGKVCLRTVGRTDPKERKGLTQKIGRSNLKK